jgi:hypothetical protein
MHRRSPRARLRIVRLLVACTFVAVAGLHASLGRADAPADGSKTVQLVYSRGPGTDQCPDEEELRDGVSARLGYDPFDGSAKSKVSARIAKDGKTLRATIEVIDAKGAVTGSRELSSTKNDCTELASAMTLTLSMVIDPVGKPPAPLPVPTPTAAPDPPPPPAPPPPPTAAPTFIAPPPPRVIDAAPVESKPHEPVRLRLGAFGQGALGFAPRSSFGATALIGIDLRTFSLDLEGRRDAPTTIAAGRGEITTSVLLASLAPCLHRSIAFGCAVVSLGSLQASGGGVAVTSAQSSVFLGAGLRSGVEVPVSSIISLVARLEVMAPLIRTVVRLDGDDVWSAPTLAGSFGLGAVVFF